MLVLGITLVESLRDFTGYVVVVVEDYVSYQCYKDVSTILTPFFTPGIGLICVLDGYGPKILIFSVPKKL